MSVDTVVIGAGLDGLVAASVLTRAGKGVVLLEKRDDVGGVLSTGTIEKGFRCDTGVHEAGLLSPSLVRQLDLETHGLEVLPGAGVVSLADEKDALHLPDDVAKAADSIRRYSTTDAARWPDFVKLVRELSGFLGELYDGPPPRIDADTFGEHLSMLSLGRRFRKLGSERMVALLRTLPMSVAEWLEDTFETDLLKGAMAAQGISRVTLGPRSGATSFVFLHHALGRTGATGAPLTARGGVGAIAEAMSRSARAAGVSMRTGAIVREILMNGNRATGVRLDSGEVIESSAIVSTADARATFLELCDPARLDPDFVRAVRNIRYRGSWAKVNLSLDGLPRFGGPRLESAHLNGLIVVAPSIDYLEKAYDAAKYGGISARPYLEIRIPSLADSSLAPEGKHVMSVQVQYAPYRLRDGSWDGDARERLGDLVMSALEQYAPGTASLVRTRQVLTPRDLEEKYSLPEGDANHGELALDQVLFMRPVAGWSHYRSPIDGLFMAGRGTHPAGALAGGAGRLAAKSVLKSRG
jgi:phytoene dehydrogenase-like protein